MGKDVLKNLAQLSKLDAKPLFCSLVIGQMSQILKMKSFQFWGHVLLQSLNSFVMPNPGTGSQGAWKEKGDNPTWKSVLSYLNHG